MTARTFTLHPGDVACGERGDRLETLLGSCVAIILTDPRRTIGVMCHVVHVGSRSNVGDDAAHGHVALATMFQVLVGHGITPQLCQAYVYGGGNMFPALVHGHRHVGQSNARWALEALAAHGVQVLHHDLGGTAYRRLAWTVGPGEPEVSVAPVNVASAHALPTTGP